MCFSAKANFIVGSVIGITGLLAMYKTRGSKYIYLAAVPVIFCIQQFFEGVVWLHMKPEFEETPWSTFSLYAYLFFALLFWPLWIPISTMIPEKIQWRKSMCYLALLVGIFVFVMDAGYLYLYPVIPINEGHNLFYGEALFYMRLLYVIAILLPLFVSSIKYMWVMGLLILASFILANLVYYLTFTSVWCFFAAALSVFLYVILPKPSEQNRY